MNELVQLLALRIWKFNHPRKPWPTDLNDQAQYRVFARHLLVLIREWNKENAD
jgi:hypothetical protein